MREGFFRKAPGGYLVPDDEDTVASMQRVKVGRVLKMEYSEPRNYEFHKKFMAMMRLAFDAWEPHEVEYEGERVGKNFERFRKDITILAGYYEATVNLKGEVRLEAQSISFAGMEQETFEKLYGAAATVILHKVLTNYTREDLDRVVNEMLSFVS